MKTSLVLCLLAATLAAPALARNTTYMLPLADVVDSPEAKARLDGSVKFHFGEKTLPAGAELKGFDVISRIGKASTWRGTSAGNNAGGGPPPVSATRASNEKDDDIAACKAAALDALVALQDKAKQLGANAVVEFVSYYKNTTFSSATEYECHAGATGGHLTFKATYAVLPKN
jgi:hypothetical protein